MVIATKHTLPNPTFFKSKTHYFEQCITNKEIIMNSFQILGKENQPVSMSTLDAQAAGFWNPAN